MAAESANRLTEFTNMHDQFIRDWEQAMLTGNTSAVERMDDAYFAVFLNDGKPVTYNKEEAIAGMRQSVKELAGAKKLFRNRIIRLRNDRNGVVFFEQVIERNGEVLARLFTIENWRLYNGNWVLTRETEEPI